MMDSEYEIIDSADSGLEDEQVNAAEATAALHQWLFPTEYTAQSGEYHKHLHCRVEGTGKWIRDSDLYASWHDGDTGFLWVKGVPGSGKSVVAASTVNHLAEENIPTLYFFFRHIIISNRKPIQLVRDWLSQLLPHSKYLIKKLGKLQKTRPSLEEIPFETFWSVFKSAAVRIPKVYCVADALDEMEAGNSGFFRQLLDLGLLSPKTLKVFVTSRPSSNIEAVFQQHAPQICLEPQSVANDIKAFVSQRVAAFNLSSSRAAAIESAINKRADGIFLYARLMLDNLVEADSASLEERLSQLPRSLNQMYNLLLQEHSSRSGIDQQTQFNILQWITHSARPLRLIELANVLKLLPQGSHRSIQQSKDLVRTACGPLLEVMGDETVQIIHHSLTEFLVHRDMRDADMSGEFPIIKSPESNQHIALICLQYICTNFENNITPASQNTNSGKSDQKLNLNGLLRDHPFLMYAANYWPHHVRQSTTLQASLDSDVHRLLSSEHPIRAAWLNYISKDAELVSHFETTKVPSVFIASSLGFATYTTLLLKEGVDPNCKSDDLLTPLMFASKQGHTDVMAILLQQGIDVEQEDSWGLTAIDHAVAHNQAEALSLLIHAGGNPLHIKPETENHTSRHNKNRSYSRNTAGEVPLMEACLRGHAEVADILLKYTNSAPIAEFNIAIERRYIGIAKMIINCGLVSSATTFSNQRVPLTVAAAQVDLPCVKLLLDRGIGVSKASVCDSIVNFYSSGRNLPLHNLCWCSSPVLLKDPDSPISIAKLLIENGFDVNAQNDDGVTPFMFAVEKGNTKLVELLLSYGADPRIETKSGESAIHRVCLSAFKPDFGALDTLLATGIGIDTPDRNGNTLLIRQLPRQVFGINALNAFLEKGADPNHCNNRGESALHKAVYESFEGGIVERLLQAGADPNKRDWRGETCAFRHDSNRKFGDSYLTCMTALVNAGLDLSAVNSLGQTALHTAAWGGNTDAMQVLVNLGADVLAKDYSGKTVLHYLFQNHGFNYYLNSHRSALLEKFRSSGVDPLATDMNGDSILHLFGPYPGSLSKTNPVQSLVDLGAGFAARNKQGRTPLHAAQLYEGNHFWSEAIIEHLGHESVHVKDLQGIQPIHLAAETSESNAAKLLQFGADPEATDYELKTPLHYAARAGLGNVVLALCSVAPISINKADIYDHTPLFYACGSGNSESVKVLLDHGATLPTFWQFIDTLRGFSNKAPAAESNIREVIKTMVTSGLSLSKGANTMWKSLTSHQDSLSGDIISGLHLAYPELSESLARQHRLFAFQLSTSALDAVQSDDFEHLLRQAREISEETALPLVLKTKLPIVLRVLCKFGLATYLQAWIDHHGPENAKQLASAWDREGDGLITIACQRYSPNMEVLQILLQLGLSIDHPERKGEAGEASNALHALAKADARWKLEALKLLLQHGGNADARNNQGQTALGVAVSSCGTWQAETIEVLIERGCDVNAIDNEGLTVLNHAAQSAPKLVTILLKRGANPNGGVVSPVCSAFAVSNLITLGQLLQFGADSNLRVSSTKLKDGDEVKVTRDVKLRVGEPLLYTIATSRFGDQDRYDFLCQSLELLLEHGADPWALYDGTTILHKIVLANGIMRPFLNKEVDVNYQDQLGRTLLMAAYDNKSDMPSWRYRSLDQTAHFEASAVESLLANGADFSLEDCSSQTLLHYLAGFADKEAEKRKGSHASDLFERCSSAGVAINHKDSKGRTPLFYALQSGNMRMVSKLLDARADVVDIGADNGQTALHLLAPHLCLWGEGIAEWGLLVERGLDPDTPDNDGNTSLFSFLAARHKPGSHFTKPYVFRFPSFAVSAFETISEGRNVHAKNKKGETLLHVWANRRGQNHSTSGPNEKSMLTNDTVTLFQDLMQRGLDPRAEDNTQMSPLDIAAVSKNTPLMDLFVQPNKRAPLS